MGLRVEGVSAIEAVRLERLEASVAPRSAPSRAAPERQSPSQATVNRFRNLEVSRTRDVPEARREFRAEPAGRRLDRILEGVQQARRRTEQALVRRRAPEPSRDELFREIPEEESLVQSLEAVERDLRRAPEASRAQAGQLENDRVESLLL